MMVTFWQALIKGLNFEQGKDKIDLSLLTHTNSFDDLMFKHFAGGTFILAPYFIVNDYVNIHNTLLNSDFLFFS